MTVEVSKVTAYAVIRPAADEVVASKVTVYAVMKIGVTPVATVQTIMIIN